MAKKPNKLPKKIAGYKIPKLVRKNSQPILALLAHHRVQALIGAAVAAALTALAETDTVDAAAAKPKSRSRASTGVEEAPELARESFHRATDIAEALGRAVASAIANHLPGHAAKAAPTQH